MNKKPLLWDKPADFNLILKHLQANQLVISTTDTVLGILGLFCEDIKNNLDAIKQRSSKPYIILIDKIETINYFLDKPLCPDLYQFLEQAWPGPLTIIIKAGVHIPQWAQSPEGTIALRFPRHEGLSKLLAICGMLFSTSANRTGQQTPSTYQELDSVFLENLKISIIVDSLTKSSHTPSTIVDFSSRIPRIIRVGAYHSAELDRLCRKK